MDMNLFEMLGFENPVEEPKKEEKKAEKKAPAKKAEKKVTKKTIKLPIDVTIPYADVIAGFTIEGKEEATDAEICEELGKRYPWCICTSLEVVTGKENTYSLVYKPYGSISKGDIEGTVLMYGAVEIHVDTVDGKVSFENCKKAIVDADAFFTDVPMEFFAKDGVIVPVLKPNKFKDGIKQSAVSMLVPGVNTIVVHPAEGKDEILPDDAKALIPETLRDMLEPCIVKGKNTVIICMPIASVKSAPIPANTFDISSGEVKVSLVFTKIDLLPENFGGKTDLTQTEILDYIVSQGYPEYSAKRASIESIDNNLLIAIIKSSTKGAIC